jgi:hypothetical protein
MRCCGPSGSDPVLLIVELLLADAVLVACLLTVLLPLLRRTQGLKG